MNAEIMNQSLINKELENQSLVRERDFFKSKVEDLENQVKTLSTEHAYVQKKNNELRTKLKEAVARPLNRFKKPFRRN